MHFIYLCLKPDSYTCLYIYRKRHTQSRARWTLSISVLSSATEHSFGMTTWECNTLTEPVGGRILTHDEFLFKKNHSYFHLGNTWTRTRIPRFRDVEHMRTISNRWRVLRALSSSSNNKRTPTPANLQNIFGCSFHKKCGSLE